MKLISFSGRISKFVFLKQFLIIVIFLSLFKLIHTYVSIGIYTFFMEIYPVKETVKSLVTLTETLLILYIVSLLFSVLVKRVHDFGESGSKLLPLYIVMIIEYIPHEYVSLMTISSIAHFLVYAGFILFFYKYYFLPNKQSEMDNIYGKSLLISENANNSGTAPQATPSFQETEKKALTFAKYVYLVYHALIFIGFLVLLPFIYLVLMSGRGTSKGGGYYVIAVLALLCIGAVFGGYNLFRKLFGTTGNQ